MVTLCYLLLGWAPDWESGELCDGWLDLWGTSLRIARSSALAQLVEQLTVNQRVAGSSPAGGAIFPALIRELVTRWVHWLGRSRTTGGLLVELVLVKILPGQSALLTLCLMLHARTAR